MARMQSEVDMAVFWSLSRAGVPRTLSEMLWERDPATFRRIMHHFDFAKDAVGISAREPDGRAVYIIIPLPSVTSLTPRSREVWQMLSSHFDAGYRLRRGLEPGQARAVPALPHGAEALIEPTHFRVTEAQGAAKSRSALEALRDAAKRVDRARGRMRDTEPERALELWRALVRGRWSTVDWFDSDGRRFVLGVPNALPVSDPRGLSEREYQAVAYAAAGETNKMIGYHLGLSKGRVSCLLSSAMRKLQVENRAQLVQRFRDFSRGVSDLEGPPMRRPDGSSDR
jgi:DNA-binding CsgD family transcriptional regulator